MENNEKLQEKLKISSSDAFSYSWYPTQCEIGASSREGASTNASLSQDSYRVFKTDTDDEMVVVQQKAPEQTTQRSSQYSLNLSNKFTDQQVKVLMKTWKELYDKRQHIRTSESDWHDITDRVNMAPGCAKTVKQVKKKFKNLRDRYRASKMKNKKRSFGLSKSVSHTQFEQVYGDIDKQEGRHRPRDLNEDAMPNRESLPSCRGVSMQQNTNLQNSTLLQSEVQRKSLETINSLETQNTSPKFSHPQFCQNQSFQRQSTTSRAMLSTNDLSTVHSQGQKFNFSTSLPQATPPMRPTTSLDAQDSQDYRSGLNSSLSPIAANTGVHHSSGSESGPNDSQLVNAVRELQQQQITMQRDMMRGMKQMEERILSEVSSKVRESEDRFRQQIANALTQLGNLIRIT